MKTLLCSFLFLGHFAFAQNSTFEENQSLLDQLLKDGPSQRFGGTAIQIFKDQLNSMKAVGDITGSPVRFLITNQNENGTYQFEGFKMGAFAEVSMCQDYKIRFAGMRTRVYVPFNRTTGEAAHFKLEWQITEHSVQMFERSQCL